ncbi:MAG TPA: hypothetical protein DCS48_07045 [Desulfovibrio sp.]|nr:hypothetical protein [Desulfovibrio sp.]
MDRNTPHYASVKTRIKGHGRISSSLESQPVYRGFTGMKKHPAADLDDSKVPEWLRVYVTELDRKLDQLLGIQNKKDLKQDFPFDLEIIKISGNGMTFRSETVTAPGLMEVVVEIEQIPLRLAGAKGHVEAGEGKNIWTIKFEKIREHDLESIIQFVFSEQREIIRTEKLG